jgi:hypothetical protein
MFHASPETFGAKTKSNVRTRHTGPQEFSFIGSYNAANPETLFAFQELHRSCVQVVDGGGFEPP